MADKNERERMYLGEEVVTVLNRSGRGKNAQVNIRKSTGFITTVAAKDLTPMDKTDPKAKLHF